MHVCANTRHWRHSVVLTYLIKNVNFPKLSQGEKRWSSDRKDVLVCALVSLAYGNEGQDRKFFTLSRQHTFPFSYFLSLFSVRFHISVHTSGITTTTTYD